LLRVTLILLALTASATTARATPPTVKPSPIFVGGETCAGCHQDESAAWLGSHHDLAMQTVSSETVLGDFSDQRFEYNGLVSRFFKRGSEYWISTDGPDGKLQDYRVEYVFGVHPLQQYLLTLPGGRLHALSIAWDSRTAEEGGQRWFHLYPDESVDASDPLHWTGAYQNWNTRCAECHSTNLQKNFDPKSGEFATTWTELNVNCEACHGAGRRHVSLAREGKLAGEKASGFPVDLAERGEWLFTEGNSIARRQAPLERSQQIEACGRCHSRRGTLGDYEYGKDLLDTHRLSLLEAPLYHPDGQILDEVYVHGSFLQSKMYQAGVVCSNCHEPHSNRLRAPGNGVCAQCHRADTYDSEQHHHHPESSAGAQCANCHMPETTYMEVDPRRDHSLRIPRPDLSVVIGTPNACNQCHSDRDAEWALQKLREWGTVFRDTASHPARALEQARRGDGRAVPQLAELAMAADQPAIWRATALVALGDFANRQAYEAAVQMLDSDDPLLRMAAVRALEFVPRQQLLGLLGKHFEDPSLAVRMEIARVLADLPLAQVDKASAAQLHTLFDQYLAVLAQHTDMPGIQLQLGVFFTNRQLWEPAELAYRRALQLNPQFLPALLNLADLYRALGREEEARDVLQQAIEIAPEQGGSHHALGLLETRAGNTSLAMASLERAAELEDVGIRHRYVYAIALHDNGELGKSIEILKRLNRSAPENPDLLLALVTYSREAGRRDDARRYAARLKDLVPDNPAFQTLYDSL
jgi:predicted CXXCH cytochrome family protein